mgnify:CR=1 FL=1
MDRPPAWRPPEPFPTPLETPRAIVDVHREEGAAAFLASFLASRATLMPWMPWAASGPTTEAEALALIRSAARERGFAHPENIPLGIFDRSAPRQVLGGTGFVRIEAERAKAEVGYWLRPEARGQGLCTEVVGRLVTSGFETWGFRRITIGCDGANRPSLGVAERLGFRREGHEISARWLDGRGWCDHVGFAVLADEWDTRSHRGPAA